MIPNSRMGSVIGKQGSKIKEIQDASGARLNASEGMLPGSTEVRVIHPPSTYSYANSLLSSLASSQCCGCRRRDPYRNLLHR
jgi:KH domain